MNNEEELHKIKIGFDLFFKENGRLPTSPEIDELNYLPSSRQIQRKFGGLEKLRSDLGYKDVHFGKGKFRSAIAKNSNVKGRESEIKLEKILTDIFHEVFVHTEKIFDLSKSRLDYYIYSPSGDFGIDIFQTGTIKDLQKNVNVKVSKYKNFSKELYFVVDNSFFSQKDLDQSSNSKRDLLPKNVKLVNIDTLLSILKNKKVYINPIK